jgi:hypothetical protein
MKCDGRGGRELPMSAAYMADPKYSADGRTVEPVFKIQLQECRAEWRRRHPKGV